MTTVGYWRSGLYLIGVLIASGCRSGSDAKDSTHPFDAGAEADGGAVDGGSTGASDQAGRSGAVDNAANRTSADCHPVRASEHLPPRASVMAGGEGVFTRDLYSLFNSNCGACHIEQNQGSWRVTPETFASKIQDSLDRMRSDDDDNSDGETFMPPPAAGGKKWTDRLKDKTDPIVELATLLEAWESAGSPPDVFYPASQGTDAQGSGTPDKGRTSSVYLMDPEVGIAMTNLGNCVPAKAMVGSEAVMGDALDEMFEKAEELPESLEDTDLFTLDSEALASRGVVAFAPAYTLWADYAKKVRMVRVPRGETIAFNADEQSFAIPSNTRFYKTFFKSVIDVDGHESYRKMETRLIVSRPDKINADGSRQWQALFGTYAWNEQETEAKLVRDPLRNGKPFRDRVVTYITDEQKAYDLVSDAPADLQKALEEKGLTRTYAIPGSERCIQCHMGAPDGSFVLGFTPLQLHRQVKGKHGVIEEAERDELNQLQRLIDYGIISGMNSPDDVTLLEDTQGARKPRNYYEVQAQGYMMGNCAHCHNPVGFPSVTAPELRDALNFYPNKSGGIYQFPLDRYSSRVFRGDKQQDPMPYITPSLYDLSEPGLDDPTQGEAPMQGLYKPAAGEPDTAVGKPFYIHAPWRSLIYRNVDTPFSYVDDYAILAHMPRHTPGYDCRARQLLGSWMISIPALPATTPARPAGTVFKNEAAEVESTANEAQPYVEVKPGDADFERAESDALKRVGLFRKSPRFRDCPGPDVDVIDPAVRDDPAVGTPKQHSVGSQPEDPWAYTLPMPGRSHWFVSDLTESPGDWEPRRPDWQDILIRKDPSLMRDGELQTVELVESLKVTGNEELRRFALTEVPFGLWSQGKAPCKFPASVRQVGSYLAAPHPRWMDGIVGYKPAETDPVYSVSPGGQVFATICRSCHGPEADSRSRLADTIADLTGGNTRVANLRGGLFGPDPMPGSSAKPGASIARVFGQVATEQVTAEDWAARYLAWMALGGTQRTIPSAILQLVTINTVLGEPRGGLTAIEAGTANMLETAKFLCQEVLPAFSKSFELSGAIVGPRTSDEPIYSSALVFKNGDAELWEQLCTLQNPLPVRVLTAEALRGEGGGFRLELRASGLDAEMLEYDLFRREGYGANPVGDHTGAVQASLTEANLAPWCIRPLPGPEDPLTIAVMAAWAAKNGSGSQPPICPPDALADANRLQRQDVVAWTKRGAMNAGLVAHLYMQALAKGEIKPVPDYDRCEELSP